MMQTEKTGSKFGLAVALLLVVLGAAMVFVLSACSQPAERSSESKIEVTSEPEVKEVSLDPFYALFIGNDSRYKTVDDTGGIADDDPSYGDTLMLARIDPRELKVSLLSIPRDTFCEFNGAPDKINANHLNGPDAMVKAVEDLTGVKVSYYFDEHFVDFGNMVDKLGGVSVDVPMSISWSDILKGGDVVVDAGDDQLLNGSQALAFVRVRKIYTDYGDACRQNNARELVQKAITAVAGNSADKASVYADLIMGVCDTNIDKDSLETFIEQFMGHADEIQFQLGTGPYMDSEAESNGGILAVPRDEATYAALIEAMENGGDMDSIVTPQGMY